MSQAIAGTSPNDPPVIGQRATSSRMNATATYLVVKDLETLNHKFRNVVTSGLMARQVRCKLSFACLRFKDLLNIFQGTKPGCEFVQWCESTLFGMACGSWRTEEGSCTKGEYYRDIPITDRDVPRGCGDIPGVRRDIPT
jgi:hypothetical protein